MEYGLTNDPSLPTPGSTADPSMVPHAFGMVAIESLDQIAARDAARERATAAQNKPAILGLVSYVRECWSAAYNARRTTKVEERMLQSLRQRRGEYDPDVLAEIRKQGGSEIYMMLSSNKARAAAGWLRDVLLGTGKEKPWTINPSPLPDLPAPIMQGVMALAQQEAQAYMQATGQQASPAQMIQVHQYVKDRVIANAKKKADEACDRMEQKMEDQLVEGGFAQALTEFIEDIVTFPSAFLAGPIVRKKNKMKWIPDAQSGFQLQIEETLTLEWERIDPFMVYPMPHVTNIDDGGIFRRHRMTRGSLAELRGVEGYNSDAIDTVLDEFGKGGLHDWLIIDTQKATAEGKSAAMLMANPEATIDALQYMGSVQGKMLVDWGMDEAQIPDQMKEYSCEVWLIGNWVIKAQLNADPLGRKNIYKASYEEVPGAFWGNSVMDLCRDVQTQCNTAARAMANNMGLGAGAQVACNVDRLPTGEDLTQMYPGKIWQFTSDPYGNNSQPVQFFSVPMISGELMQIYMFFSQIADEHTGIPRYMAGDATGSGALRTSSGMSMLMGNASKGLKQVVANIDTYVLNMAIERLYFYNMQYSDDPDLKGDVNVVARGANSLVVKETQQQRINEFLQLALTNPIVNQIVGEEAIGALLRTAAKNLDMDTDQIVPPPEVIRARVFQAQQAQAANQKQAQDFQMAMALAPSRKQTMEQGPEGVHMKVEETIPHIMQQAGITPGPGLAPGNGANPAQTMSSSGQMTGNMPVTDSFSPMRKH